ncbi:MULTISPECIES: Uma2 family endonuclease [unclassified Coleofasciculus]|uniref:Uma2 family endonuclease n=1 Tax=unclassified Coleofasciculus TaxID=2692782 RepID=UPI0018813803|nr:MULTISPECIES: Uma2 family endonuclease [unclassified Coleofasciculus]MBE9125451.1 Uma2 family endonuclease [Coleofasciculus sp. LEGE 07081]MBE9147137.1 Uma2 family endonuclease [Coleofasciculus sp. LEGE 07092]
MLEYNLLDCLPSAEDLPDSDDTPVDNELQDLIPSLLKAVLALLWVERWDWFFGVDMGVYYHPEKPAIVPDGFLSIGVERFIDEDLRLSYVLWEEQVVPILVLEVVSHKRRGEYSTKKRLYGEMGVLYYVVYNPLRRRKSTLEVYRLVDGVYQLQSGNPVWLAEIGLGIGAERGMYQGIRREWLYWYDEQGQRILTPEEQIEQERQRVQEAEQLAQQERQRTREAEQLAQQERQRVQLLEERLRALGVDPESLL